MPRSSGARALKTAAPLFGALGDRTRLGLVARLCEQGPLSITRLTAGTDVTRQAITRHLRVLAKAGVVRGMREGRESVWELQPRRLQEAQRHLDQISKQWDKALDRLRALVEA
jgi:DNA-binding transcriptional ArsR family regulator